MNQSHATIALALLVGFLLSPNRIRADEPKPPVRSEHFERMEFKGRDGTKLVCFLMKPAVDTQAPGKKYPLVLTLHGRGGNTQAAAVLAGEAMRNQHSCYVLAPVASRAERWAMPKNSRALPGRSLLPTVLEAVDDALAKLPIDANRVYVTGQSMGGFGTFGALAARPELFAAAVPVCGGWDPAEAKGFAKVPVWAFHGSKDNTVKPEQSERMVDALKAAGGAPKFTLYEGVGHNSWTRAYGSPETWKWLFAQRQSAPKTDNDDTDSTSTSRDDR